MNKVALAAVFLSLASCDMAVDQGYTLYRSSTLDEQMRIHVASFDAADGEKYNSENCLIAAELFQSQPAVTVRYWCEKGRFKE